MSWTLDNLRPRLQDLSRYLPRLCGVYLFVERDQVVYVGKSTNVIVRIHSHLSNEAPNVYYVPCDEQDLSELETALILLFRPTNNGRTSRGAMCVSAHIPDVLVKTMQKYGWQVTRDQMINHRPLPPAPGSRGPLTYRRATQAEINARAFDSSWP